MGRNVRVAHACRPNKNTKKHSSPTWENVASRFCPFKYKLPANLALQICLRQKATFSFSLSALYKLHIISASPKVLAIKKIRSVVPFLPLCKSLSLHQKFNFRNQ